MQRRRFLSVALVALAAAPLSAQDAEDEPFPTMEEILGSAATQDPQDRMTELFHSVETKLKTVDVFLTDAAAGDTSSLTKVTNPGIADLLRTSLDEGRAAQRDIAEILEIAQQLGQSQGGGGT